LRSPPFSSQSVRNHKYLILKIPAERKSLPPESLAEEDILSLRDPVGDNFGLFYLPPLDELPFNDILLQFSIIDFHIYLKISSTFSARSMT